MDDWEASGEIVAQSSTPFTEGGPRARVCAQHDGWNVNLHFIAGGEHRTYVFDIEQADLLMESLHAARLVARKCLP